LAPRQTAGRSPSKVALPPAASCAHRPSPWRPRFVPRPSGRRAGEPLPLRLWNLDVVVLADLDQVGRLVQLVEVDIPLQVLVFSPNPTKRMVTRGQVMLSPRTGADVRGEVLAPRTSIAAPRGPRSSGFRVPRHLQALCPSQESSRRQHRASIRSSRRDLERLYPPPQAQTAPARRQQRAESMTQTPFSDPPSFFEDAPVNESQTGSFAPNPPSQAASSLRQVQPGARRKPEPEVNAKLRLGKPLHAGTRRPRAFS
jgi:hypothetical protein